MQSWRDAMHGRGRGLAADVPQRCEPRCPRPMCPGDAAASGTDAGSDRPTSCALARE